MTLYPEIGENIWVGNFQACDEKSAEFDRVIHLWHPYQQGSGICQASHLGLLFGMADDTPRVDERGSHLFVCYEDKNPLGDLIEPVWNFASNRDRLLLHCAAGLCRSPTFAILCLAARGVEPTKAIDLLHRAMWRGLRTTPHLSNANIYEIFTFAESRGWHSC